MTQVVSPLTQAISEFVVSPGFTGAGEAAAYPTAKLGMMDAVASAMAGSREAVVDIVLRQALEQGGVAECPLIWGGQGLPARQAALVNAVAGHALDYDDVALSAHPSIVLTPALLAEAHRLRASGSDILRAYTVGFEVWAELFAREPDSLHGKGWHPTGMFGAVAACAAVAHLRRLPAQVARSALGIAASLSGGIVANYGTMTKPLHAGRAAANAIEAVELAVLGLTSAPDALEHNAGLLAAISPRGRADRASPFTFNPDRPRLATTGISVKRYPVCYSSHRVIDGILDLKARDSFATRNIRKIEVTIGEVQAAVLRNHRPTSVLEAKFSLEFAAAAALIAGKVGLEELSDGFVKRPDVQAMFERISVQTSKTICPVDPSFGFADRVQIICSDGSLWDSGDIRFPRGNAANPMNLGELRQKFTDCVAAGRTRSDGSVLYRKLAKLEDLAGIDTLFG